VSMYLEHQVLLLCSPVGDRDLYVGIAPHHLIVSTQMEAYDDGRSCSKLSHVVDCVGRHSCSKAS
jgi:hypothetical protein